MYVIQAIGRFFDRLLAFRLQRLPFYRGQADRLLHTDDQEPSHRTPQTAREADLPPRKR